MNPRTERGRGFRGDGLVKGYDEMNAEQRLCFDAGYMAAQRDAKAERDALREVADAARNYRDRATTPILSHFRSHFAGKRLDEALAALERPS